MDALHQSLPDPKRGRHFANKDELAAEIDHLLDAGDVVMIKASNGVGLGQAVDATS